MKSRYIVYIHHQQKHPQKTYTVAKSIKPPPLNTKTAILPSSINLKHAHHECDEPTEYP